jgi:hypothetical protein
MSIEKIQRLLSTAKREQIATAITEQRALTPQNVYRKQRNGTLLGVAIGLVLGLLAAAWLATREIDSHFCQLAALLLTAFISLGVGLSLRAWRNDALLQWQAREAFTRIWEAVLDQNLADVWEVQASHCVAFHNDDEDEENIASGYFVEISESELLFVPSEVWLSQRFTLAHWPLADLEMDGEPLLIRGELRLNALPEALLDALYSDDGYLEDGTRFSLSLDQLLNDPKLLLTAARTNLWDD